MCLLQNKIKNILTRNDNLLAYGKKWTRADNAKIEASKLEAIIVERKNIQGTSSGTQYKYIEYTKWKNTNTNDTCVIIGFNPAVCDPSEMDGTNVKLINALKDSYESCILLNLYPRVANNKKLFNKPDNEDLNFHKTLLEILRMLIKRNIKAIIFWGRTASIPQEIYEKLQEMQTKNLLKMTVKKETSQHYHPARVNIEIQDVSEGHLTNKYKLI